MLALYTVHLVHVTSFEIACSALACHISCKLHKLSRTAKRAMFDGAAEMKDRLGGNKDWFLIVA
jgi:hypothetical protein